MTLEEAFNRLRQPARTIGEEFLMALPIGRLRAFGLEARANRVEKALAAAEAHLDSYGLGSAPPEMDMPWPTVSSEMREIRAGLDRIVADMRAEAAQLRRHP